MLKSIEQWLFPSICCICRHYTKTEQDLCAICKASLPWLEERCFRCGLFLNDNVDSVYCQKCLIKPPHFDRLCGLFNYESPIIQLITGLKFGAELAYGRILGELLADHVQAVWYKGKHLPEAVLPVPLHSKRLQKRGFNQALEFLYPIEKKYHIPIVRNACTRIRHTPAQSQLNKSRRQRNMSNVFQVVEPLPFEHIAIMDDVVTTGSTVDALASVLKAAGIITVDVWCICRA